MNIRSIVFLSAVLFAPVVLSATANTAKKEDECIFSNQISGWNVLDSRHVMVWKSPREPYLMTLIAPLPDTTVSLALAFVDKDRDGMICGHSSDAVSVPHSGIRTIPSIISGMHRVDDAELQQLSEKYKVNLVPKKKKDKSSSSSATSGATADPEKKDPS